MLMRTAILASLLTVSLTPGVVAQDAGAAVAAASKAMGVGARNPQPDDHQRAGYQLGTGAEHLDEPVGFPQARRFQSQLASPNCHALAGLLTDVVRVVDGQVATQIADVRDLPSTHTDDGVGTGVLGGRRRQHSRSGKYMWHHQLGAGLRSTGGTTYVVDGRQYLLLPAGLLTV